MFAFVCVALIICAFFASMAALAHFAPNIGKGWFGTEADDESVQEARDLANLRTETHVATPLCTARWDLLHCDRAAWHAGQHAHTMPSGKVVAWPNLADCGGAA